ncbi:MAG: hypothetical protein NTX61_16015 [Bacteroidetes bacterium]|nr:hypothetical protein [Bacteroidota bacterium]
MTLEALALQGNSTIYGSMAANIGSRISDIRKDLIKNCFTDFRGREHRLEFVANIHGIEFINDSKATNINSTWFALESMNKPVILIAGGIDKGNNFEIIKPLVIKKVKTIIWLGKDSQRMISILRETGILFAISQSMKDAVEMAYLTGKQGDVVLLSPGCPSFDLFNDYEDRGREFKLEVKKL